jgi:hypothetical protein
MALDETIEKLTTAAMRSPGVCAYQVLYDRLSQTDQKALDSALERKLPVTLIVKALRQEGHQTSSDSVRAHLKGQCRCLKK